jgi:hypothetical protein
VNNTAYNNGTVVGYPDIFTNNCNDVNIMNNIIYSRTGGKCNSAPMHATEVYDYNIYFNGTVAKKGIHDLVVDPQFVKLNLNLTDGDFHLKSTSPAINSGTNSIYLKNDIEGRIRPIGSVVDRGAYEFDPATSISDLELPGNSFYVYSNPATNWISIVSKTGSDINKLELFSCSGKLVLSNEITKQKENELDLSKFKSGIYILKISCNEKCELMKLIKL